jgi:hypothetical protein
VEGDRGNGKGWEKLWESSLIEFNEQSLPVLRSIHANMINLSKVNASMDPKYRDPEFQRQFAELEAARKQSKSKGGLLGTLVGAAVGVAAAGYFDVDAADALAMVSKAAAATSEDSSVQAALNSIGDAALTSGGAAAAGSGASGAAEIGAAYPTRPNLAVGACPGFTESNYRQRALEGGGDTQLYTLCGQAFEYYTMYKRAISQGYSEADANRTYAAHEQSARVTNSFRQTHAAD